SDQLGDIGSLFHSGRHQPVAFLFRTGWLVLPPLHIFLLPGHDISHVSPLHNYVVRWSARSHGTGNSPHPCCVAPTQPQRAVTDQPDRHGQCTRGRPPHAAGSATPSPDSAARTTGEVSPLCLTGRTNGLLPVASVPAVAGRGF